MKNRIYFPFIYLFIVFITFSCNKEDNRGGTPEEIDNPKLREVTGGTPDESTTLVSGSFMATEKNCKSGFGLCNLNFIDPTAQYPDSTKKNPNEKTYKAIFTLSTSADTLKIEFDEVIPHAEDFLSVSGADTITNVLGHEYIVPVRGKYRLHKGTDSKYGNVEVKVVKGKAKSAYATNPKKDTNKHH